VTNLNLVAMPNMFTTAVVPDQPFAKSILKSFTDGTARSVCFLHNIYALVTPTSTKYHQIYL